MNSVTRRASVALMFVGALALAGCSAHPTSPAPGSGYELIHDPLGGEPGLEPLPPSPSAPAETALVKRTVKGQTGGTLRAGSFTLQVPPGAYTGNATITLRQPDTRILAVEIEISPASKNNFKRTATLTANVASLDPAVLSEAEMWVYDPVTRTFALAASSTLDMDAATVKASFTSLTNARIEN